MNEEEKKAITLYVILIAISYTIFFAGLIYGTGVSEHDTDTHTETNYVYTKDTLDWDKFIYSVAYVESRNKPSAIGKDNDNGLLQITPIMVSEANRILGCDKYAVNDRMDSLLAVEIFNVVQLHHNPEKSPYKACLIWNPKASLKYYCDIMDKYNELNK